MLCPGGRHARFWANLYKHFEHSLETRASQLREPAMSAIAWDEAGRLAFQNLLLLGFDPDEAEKRHGIGISEETFLQQQMAGSGLGPHKAMEVVMHFLLLKGLPAEAHAPLKMLFPVVEKQQARDFRKFAADNLGALQKARELPASPLIRTTVFDCPCGPKFCQVLFHFSQYTMRRQMLAIKKSAGLVVPPFERKIARSLVRVARHRLAHERKLFLDHVYRAGAAHDQWIQFSHELVEAYQSAQASRAEVQAAQQALFAQMVESDICLDHDVAEAKAEEMDESVRSMWMEIGQSGVASASHRESVGRLLVNPGHEKCINIPEIMLQRTQELDPSAPIARERLDMEALLQRWAATIGQVHRQLFLNVAGREGLERLAASAPDLQGLAEEAHTRLVEAQSLRSQLGADVEDVRRSITGLRKEVGRRYQGVVGDPSLEEVPSPLKGSAQVRPGVESTNSLEVPSSFSGYGERAAYTIGSPSSQLGSPAASRRWQSAGDAAPAAQASGDAWSKPNGAPIGGVDMSSDKLVGDASARAKVSELDVRMQRLRKQLESPPRGGAPQAVSSVARGSSVRPLASSLVSSSPPSAALKRPPPLPLASESNGHAKPSPPATPPPLYAALRGKRMSNGHSVESPANAKTVLEDREVLVGKEAACDPAQSEIERRRASLRSKLAGTIDDDILVPPVSNTALAKELAQAISPPKEAGKGCVVQDDISVGRFFGD